MVSLMEGLDDILLQMELSKEQIITNSKNDYRIIVDAVKEKCEKEKLTVSKSCQKLNIPIEKYCNARLQLKRLNLKRI